jgi:hypothetical protein
MRGKGWIEAASCFQHRIKKGKHHRYYNGQYLRKKHVQRCDNHLGDQLIQRLRKKKNWSELRWCCFHPSVCLDTEHNISSDIYQIMLLSAIFKIAAVSPVNLYLPTTKKE